MPTISDNIYIYIYCLMCQCLLCPLILFSRKYVFLTPNGDMPYLSMLAQGAIRWLKGGAIKVTFVTLGLINRINASAGSNLLRHVDDTGVQIRKIAIVTLFSPCFHYIIDVLYLLLYCGIFILYGAAIITRLTNFSYQNL